MSEQQQVQEADRIVRPRDVARFFRRDCRGLRDSLQLEMAVAQYYLQMRAVLSPEGVPIGDAASAGIIADLERHADALSHAILRGLAHQASGEIATRSADAVARLSEQGVGLPRQFSDVGEARAVAAWRDTEGAHEGEFALFADFEHPRGPRHCVALFVDRDVAKHVGLLPPLAEVGYPHNDLEELDVAEAGALMRSVLDRSFPREPGDPDEFRILMASARARSIEPALPAP
jgi:hypothetical protein